MANHSSGLLRAAFMLAIATVSSSAEGKEYTLTAKELYDAISAQCNNNFFTEDNLSRDYNFEVNGISWTMSMVNSEECVGYDLYPSDGDLTIFGYATFVFSFTYELTLTAVLPQMETIGSVDVDMGLRNSSGEMQTYTCKAAGFSNKQMLAAPSNLSSITPVHFDVGGVQADKVSVTISSDQKSDMGFREFKITVSDALKSVAPTLANTVPVGHVLSIGCDDPDAALYYRVNDPDGAWQEYDHNRGLLLSRAGLNTIEYYSHSAGREPSAVQRAQLNVVQPSGLEAAKALGQPISVSGVVAGQGKGYTLVGHSAADSVEDCLAVDNSGHSALASVALGTPVEVTGRATDRFPQPGLGSITVLTVNGQSVESGTTSAAAMGVQTPTPRITSYDLQGRPSTKARILVHSDGTKTLTR